MAAAQSTPDWQCGKNLSECFDHIYTSGLASDVTFIVGEDQKRISAHKLVLISRSPVFYAMLEGPMAERGEITIPDISEDIFRLFLRYLYTDTIHFTDENVVPVLNAARKYCVDILVSRCEDFIKNVLSEDNACLFLEHAHLFTMENLKTECLNLIFDSPTTTLQSSSFSDLCSSCVTSITTSDDLGVDEIDVYRAVIKWAEAKCKRQDLEVTPENSRTVLGDILYNVRFPVMDYGFFQKVVCHDKILPNEDVIQVTNYHHHKEKVSDSKLNHNEREFPDLQRFWRLEEFGSDEQYPGTDSVSFSASDTVHLHGFGSFCSEESDIVDVVIYENDRVVYKAEEMSGVASDSQFIKEVVFRKGKRIRIKPGNVYSITEHHYAYRCLPGVEALKYYRGDRVFVTPLQFKHATITFQASPAFLRCNTQNSNQIPYLLLS